MRHGTHCAHCGATMPIGRNICRNNECEIGANELPSWPWSRCHGADRNIVYTFMTGWQRARLLWPPTLGILVLLIGMLSHSERFMAIGIICMGGWAAGRFGLQIIRTAQTKLNTAISHQTTFQRRYDGKQVSHDAENREKLDECNDQVKAKTWILRGHKQFRLWVILITIFLISFLVSTWGPGRFFPWSPKELSTVASEKFLNIPVVKQAIDEGKADLEWDERKVYSLGSWLRREMNLNNKQWSAIVDHSAFNPDFVRNTTEKARLTGSDLQTHLIKSLNHRRVAMANTSPAAKPASALSEKTWWQYVKESVWFTLTWMNGLLFIAIVCITLYGAFSWALSVVYHSADELRDKLKLAVDKSIEEHEQRSNDQPVQPAAAAATAAPGATTPEQSTSVQKIFKIGMISLLFDFVYEKIFQGIADKLFTRRKMT